MSKGILQWFWWGGGSGPIFTTSPRCRYRVRRVVRRYVVPSCGGDTVVAALDMHERTDEDDYVLEIDFSRSGVFDDDPVTEAEVESSDPTLIVGDVVVGDDNEVQFRILGGTAGVECAVRITARNETGGVLGRYLPVMTEDGSGPFYG